MTERGKIITKRTYIIYTYTNFNRIYDYLYRTNKINKVENGKNEIKIITQVKLKRE